MNRNLSPQEFEQVELFGGNEYQTLGPPRPAPVYTPPVDYPDPHEGEGLGVVENPNPLYSDDAEVDVSAIGDWEPGWVPTFGVSSIQPVVNPESVDHLTRHATGLEKDQAVLSVESGGHHVLFDGNHRMNAAQRRGQLFIPGQVARTS